MTPGAAESRDEEEALRELDRDEHFLAIADWDRDRLERMIERGLELKRRRGETGGDRPLAGQSLAMIFAKSSTRTRVSFEVGASELGANPLFLSSRDIQLGRGEPIADTARVLSRYVHGIMIRTFEQSDLEELARRGSVPVINGLTDRFHPCQVLADLMTAREAFGPALGELSVAWIGDGNNMAHSWLNAAAAFGFRLRLACPEGFDPDAGILDAARGEADVELVREPAEAAAGASVVTTDVWVSMGDEDEAGERRRAFEAYHVDGSLMREAAEDAIFLHCLPAHRGEEVAAEVIDGPASRVWDEAENRLHVQKALLAELMGRAPGG